MRETNVRKHIQELLEQKHWTIYRLGQESGVPYNTLYNMMQRSSDPSFDTMFRICDGFGITIAQFFMDDAVMDLTEDEKELVKMVRSLDKEQVERLKAYLYGMTGK